MLTDSSVNHSIGRKHVSRGPNGHTAEVEGPIAAVNVVDGQAVKRGDILVVIDDTDAKLALRQAEADLARAHSSPAQTKA